MHWLKKFLRVLLTFFLLLFLVVLLLLQWPTETNQIINSTFAPRPNYNKLPKLKVEVFETAFSEAPEAFIVRGGSLVKKRKLVYPAILVSHPQGNFLIEAGLGKAGKQDVEQGPAIFRAINRFTLEKPLLEQKPNLTENLKIDFALITHSHWDHLSGLMDFPTVPLKMLAAEQSFASSEPHPTLHGINPGQIAKLRDRIQPLTLTNTPYENFSQSLDLFGDQSVVLVALPGHTPGSMGIFLNLSSTQRFFLVGDAIYSVNLQGQPEARPLLTEFFSDMNRGEARLTRRKLQELIAHSNEITLVPMHDPVALEKLKLAAPSGS